MFWRLKSIHKKEAENLFGSYFVGVFFFGTLSMVAFSFLADVFVGHFVSIAGVLILFTPYWYAVIIPYSLVWAYLIEKRCKTKAKNAIAIASLSLGMIAALVLLFICSRPGQFCYI